MPDFKNSARDQWFDLKYTSAARLQTLYGTPQSWFRRSLSLTRAGMERCHDMATENYIRCAAIFSPGTPLTPLTIDVPWTMRVDPQGRGWIMLMASPPDPEAWLQRCYESGARIFWLGNASIPLYVHRLIEHEEPELQPNPIPPRTEYRRESVEQDIRSGTMTMTAIAERHNISRNTVHKIKQRMSQPKEPKSRIPASRWPTIDEDSAVADLKSGITRMQIAERHGTTLQHISHLQRKYNIFNVKPAGRPRISNKKAP